MTAVIAQTKTDIQETIWSLSDLKQLTPDQVMDRIEQIDNQAMLYKWRLYWALRQKFPSNIEFGHYLSALRERPHSPIIESQQVINRYINAGRFAEQHKIGSLDQAGVKPSVIYLLSQPQNKAIADAIFRDIRRKNMLHKDVQRMLEQSRAVATLTTEDRPTAIEGEVIREETPTQAVAESEEQAEQIVSKLMRSIIEDETERKPEAVPVISRRRELLLELSEMDNSGVDEDEIQEDYELLDRSYRRNDLKLSEFHNIRRNLLAKRLYNK